MEQPASSAVAHPDVLAYLNAREPTATWRTGDVEALRREARAEALAVRGDLSGVGDVRAVTIGGRQARLYLPLLPGGGGDAGIHSTDCDDIVLWVHGGGWVHGDLDCYAGVTRAIAAESGRPVLAASYRLVPEHRYPAALEDVWAALEWATERYPHVALAGDSAGANLVAVTALKARDAGISLAAQVLVYPMVDSTAETEYKLAFRERYASFANQQDFGAATYQRIDQLWKEYAPDPTTRTQPWVSPMHASSLHGLAPAVIVTAEHDILRGEAEMYAERLREHGVPVTMLEFPGQVHGFFQMRSVITDAHRAMKLVVESLDDEFRRHGSPASA